MIRQRETFRTGWISLFTWFRLDGMQKVQNLKVKLRVYISLTSSTEASVHIQCLVALKMCGKSRINWNPI